VSLVRLVIGTSTEVADKLHDLVLTLSGHVVAAKYDLQVSPNGIFLDLFAF
jgi:hypothetical protein